jgi:hypothetical protein
MSGNSITDAGFKTIRQAWIPPASQQMIFHGADLIGLDSNVLGMFYLQPDRPASWRMPPQSRWKHWPLEAARQPGPLAAAPDAPLPAEYWESVLNDPRAGATGARCGSDVFPKIQRHVTAHRLPAASGQRGNSDRRCSPIVWPQRAGRRRAAVLDNTCQQRTGRHEEDGCWPTFETP